MSKVANLPLVTAPAGTETVVILKDGVAKRTGIGALVSAAFAPLIAAATDAMNLILGSAEDAKNGAEGARDEAAETAGEINNKLQILTPLYAWGGQLQVALKDSASNLYAGWLADGTLRGKIGLRASGTDGLALSYSPATGQTTISQSLLGSGVSYYANVGGVGYTLDGAIWDAGKNLYLGTIPSIGVYMPRLRVDYLVAGNIVGAASGAQSADTAGYFFTVAAVAGVLQVFRQDKAGVAPPVQITSSGANFDVQLSYDQANIIYTSNRVTLPAQYFQSVAPGGVEYPVLSSPNMVLVGDSRTTVSQGYATPLAALYPSRSISNQSVSGERSEENAARFGAIPVNVVVSGNSIPASGTVTCTFPSTNPFRRLATAAIHGSIGGVAGTLSIASSTVSFTRDTNGSATAVSNPVAFVPDSGTINGSTSASGAPVLTTLWANTAILGGGYNDLATGFLGAPSYVYNQATTLANIAAEVAALKPFVKRYLILGIYLGEGILVSGGGGIGAGQSSLGTAASQSAAKQMYDAAIALNAALLAAYGPRFVDLQSAFVTAGYGESATINGVAGCTIINASAADDGIHPSTVGKSVIANAIKANLDAKGW